MKSKFKKLLIRISNNYNSFIRFIIKLIFWVLVLVWLTPLLASVFISSFKTNALTVNNFILFITAAFIIAYTYETQKMKEQMSESELRPVVLRSGFIEEWQKVKFHWEDDKLIEGIPLEFIIAKNIATDISGYIVIDSYKHKLFFGNNISKTEKDTYSFLEKWGWMQPGSRLFAVYRDDNNKKTTEANKIYLYYKDIEGNRYFTIEDSSFSQRAFKK